MAVSHMEWHTTHGGYLYLWCACVSNDGTLLLIVTGSIHSAAELSIAGVERRQGPSRGPYKKALFEIPNMGVRAGPTGGEEAEEALAECSRGEVGGQHARRVARKCATCLRPQCPHMFA